MKLTTRGFTLVELMIVIAIIGMLSVALFPAIQGYILRGRDTARVTGIRDITSALNNYYTDSDDKYPTVQLDCSFVLSLSTYMSKIPVDPTLARNNGCGNNGNYGYGTGVITGKKIYTLSADLEGQGGGYFNASGTTNPFTGTLDVSDSNSLQFSLLKGAGQLYVIYN